jgi:5-methylcytosine-specific restriction endonuclease McrA
MAPEKAPAFQFYADQFLLDERQMVMSLDQAGAYIRLLAICWREKTIPSDVPSLAKLVGTSAARMKKLWPLIHGCFTPDVESPNRLRHPRLEVERAKQQEWREKSAEGGRVAQAGRKGGTKGGSRVVELEGQPKGNSLVSSLLTTSEEPSPTPSLAGTGPMVSEKCEYCGSTERQTGRRHEIDHFVPRRADGSDGPENLVTACHRCNQARSGRIFESIEACREWLHLAYWTSNRKRWIEHRRVAFGGLPPEGFKPNGENGSTAAARKSGLAYTDDWYAGCQHEPKCETGLMHRERLAIDAARSSAAHVDDIPSDDDLPTEADVGRAG